MQAMQKIRKARATSEERKADNNDDNEAGKERVSDNVLHRLESGRGLSQCRRGIELKTGDHRNKCPKNEECRTQVKEKNRGATKTAAYCTSLNQQGFNTMHEMFYFARGVH
jgi:hypothetical protein